MPKNTQREWLSISEAATVAGVSRRTVYNWLPLIPDDKKRKTPYGRLRIRRNAWLRRVTGTEGVRG